MLDDITLKKFEVTLTKIMPPAINMPFKIMSSSGGHIYKLGHEFIQGQILEEFKTIHSDLDKTDESDLGKPTFHELVLKAIKNFVEKTLRDYTPEHSLDIPEYKRFLANLETTLHEALRQELREMHERRETNPLPRLK